MLAPRATPSRTSPASNEKAPASRIQTVTSPGAQAKGSGASPRDAHVMTKPHTTITLSPNSSQALVVANSGNGPAAVFLASHARLSHSPGQQQARATAAATKNATAAGHSTAAGSDSPATAGGAKQLLPALQSPKGLSASPLLPPKAVAAGSTREPSKLRRCSTDASEVPAALLEDPAADDDSAPMDVDAPGNDDAPATADVDATAQASAGTDKGSNIVRQQRMPFPTIGRRSQKDATAKSSAATAAAATEPTTSSASATSIKEKQTLMKALLLQQALQQQQKQQPQAQADIPAQPRATAQQAQPAQLHPDVDATAAAAAAAAEAEAMAAAAAAAAVAVAGPSRYDVMSACGAGAPVGASEPTSARAGAGADAMEFDLLSTEELPAAGAEGQAQAGAQAELAGALGREGGPQEPGNGNQVCCVCT